MRVYLSGPMTGIKDFNRPEFARVAAMLRERGHEVISPPELPEPENLTGNDEKDWYLYLARDVAHIIADPPDALVQLDEWEKSRGARLEAKVACELGVPVEHFTHWAFQRRSR